MYLLHQFQLSNGDIVVTRGENEQQCRYYLEKMCNLKIAKSFDYCDSGAAYKYSCSHPFNWLKKPPLWVSSSMWEPNDISFREQFFKGTQTSTPTSITSAE